MKESIKRRLMALEEQKVKTDPLLYEIWMRAPLEGEQPIVKLWRLAAVTSDEQEKQDLIAELIAAYGVDRTEIEQGINQYLVAREAVMIEVDV